MKGYWFRQRFILTLLVCIVVALMSGALFVYPCIESNANTYNSQSIYKNSEMDFIVPEPSFEQVDNLPGTNGIDKIFPFFLTKMSVNVNGASRTTTVLLSDRFENVNVTMYSDERLIKEVGESVENPIFVDWQFCQDTGANIGDTISITIGSEIIEFHIAAIYETNTIYDGGAIIAQISKEQKEIICSSSHNNGYSGMYVVANDYSSCQTYLTTDYRPLGRLKDRDQFNSDDQYKTHYDAIMSSGYANEITDFRVRESSQGSASNLLILCSGAALTMIILIGFNVIMMKRGCESVYFTKHCIPKGQNVRSYYKTSFGVELILTIILLAGVVIARIYFAEMNIPTNAYSIELAIIPAAVLISESICLSHNNAKVSEWILNWKRKVEKEKAQKKGTAENTTN